jgi:hypothetical protein
MGFYIFPSSPNVGGGEIILRLLFEGYHISKEDRSPRGKDSGTFFSGVLPVGDLYLPPRLLMTRRETYIKVLRIREQDSKAGIGTGNTYSLKWRSSRFS